MAAFSQGGWLGATCGIIDFVALTMFGKGPVIDPPRLGAPAFKDLLLLTPVQKHDGAQLDFHENFSNHRS